MTTPEDPAPGRRAPGGPAIPEGFGEPTTRGMVPTDEFVTVPEGTGPEETGPGRPGADRYGPTRAELRSGGGHRSGGGDTVLAHHPFRVAALVFVVAGLVVVIGGFLWLQHEASPSGPKGAQVIVTVPPGEGTSGFASTLASKGVIGSALAYRVWSTFHGGGAIYQGTYAFNRNDSFGDVQAVLANGPNVFSLTVPAGFTVGEVAQRVGQFPGHDATTFEQLATGGTFHSPWQPPGVTSLEGLLGTGTYQLVPGQTDAQLLTAMIDRFDTQADKLNLAANAAALGVTPYQAITMASIVEKEGVIQKNLGPVARVILNRLARGMPLQMDSTVLYAEGRDGGKVTSKDLATPTPYNTYLNKGLTPTPICFPSPAALAATLHPPAGAWLYFVVTSSDGTESFADTFAQQQANEALAAQRGL